MGRSADLGKTAALYRRKTLTDGVHLHDIGTAGQQLSGNILQNLTGNQGLFKQGAAATRKQEQYGIILAQIRNQIQRSLGSGERILIGNRVSSLPAIVICDGSHHMIIFGNHHTGFDPAAQTVISCLCHLPRSFTCGHQQHPSREFPALQRTGHSFIRLHRADGCRHNCIRMITHHFFHTDSSITHRMLTSDDEFNFAYIYSTISRKICKLCITHNPPSKTFYSAILPKYILFVHLSLF